MAFVKEEKESVEDGFRSSFKDVARVLEGLGDLFETTVELHEAVTLSQSNRGQLLLLMERLTTPATK